MINIIGGKFKKTRLEVPSNEVRPTSSLKREAIFSVLESNALKNSYDLYNKKSFVDLYAGSGSLALEAISRGGFFGYFVDNDKKTINSLEKNCSKICKNKNYQIILADVLALNFDFKDNNISTIFIDPPYRINPFNDILNKIYKSLILNINTNIVIELSKKTSFEIPSNFYLFNEKIFGKTKIIFLKKK